MEENRKVSYLVTGSRAKLGVVVLAAAASVDSPFVRALSYRMGLEIRVKNNKCRAPCDQKCPPVKEISQISTFFNIAH